MRILLLAPLPFFVQRGTPISIRMLMDTLGQAGHEITAIVGPDGDDIALHNCRITRVPNLPGLRGMQPGFSIRKLVCDLLLVPMAASKLITGRYDVIHAVEESAFVAMVLGAISRVPYLCDVDSDIPEQLAESRRFPNWLVAPVAIAQRAMFRRSVAALTCCRALEELVRREAPHIEVRTIEDTTLLEQDDEGSCPADCDFPEKVIIYVGNLERYQGVDLLVQGFSEIASTRHDARLVVIGGNQSHITELQATVDKLGIAAKVSCLGPRPLSELGRYLRAATIVASPRIKGNNTPMKVYSYLDSGRPLLATRLTTHTQVLDDDTAMLVEPTAASVAAGLERLLDDEALCERLARNAKLRVRQEFSRDAFERKLLGFYNELLPSVLNPARESKDPGTRLA